MKKKNILFLSASLVLIILLGIGVSYSIWNVSVSQDTNNTAYTECFDLSITNKENNISLDNAYPISNDKGKSLTPYTFTVTNTCDVTAQYSVNLEVLNNSTLASKFIDVMFEGNINLLSSYDSTDKVNTSSIESRKLTTGILNSQESKDYSLRLWIDYNTTLEDLNNEIKSFKSKIVVVGKPINYTGDTVFNFDYTGAEQTFVAPISGTYKLETWGAQGGTMSSEIYGGYGGYSSGVIALSKATNLYINNGGHGKTEIAGYNGGGSASSNGGGGGGGASDITLSSGTLSTFNNKLSEIIIVSGGGGGSAQHTELVNSGSGGHAGGYIGGNGYFGTWTTKAGYGGTQSTGGSYGLCQDETVCGENGSFGQGGNLIECDTTHCNNAWQAGGGAGFYGGGSSRHSGGGGGSGYIGNSLLTNKVMYCYNCEESNEESTKTIATSCSEETPTSYCAKKGNGYARITLVSIDE